MKNKEKKNAKQKSFFFKDYYDSEILFKRKNKNLVKVSLNRVSFITFIFLALIFIFSIKVVYLSFSPQENVFSKEINRNFVKKRADIVDRNGSILARNIISYDAGVNPKLVKDKKKINYKFKTYFPRY